MRFPCQCGRGVWDSGVAPVGEVVGVLKGMGHGRRPVKKLLLRLLVILPQQRKYWLVMADAMFDWFSGFGGRHGKMGYIRIRRRMMLRRMSLERKLHLVS